MMIWLLWNAAYPIETTEVGITAFVKLLQPEYLIQWKYLIQKWDLKDNYSGNRREIYHPQSDTHSTKITSECPIAEKSHSGGDVDFR